MSKELTSLLQALESDVVTFTFTKVNKSSRIAEGTRNLDIIPINHHPKGTGKTPGADLIVFFDWQKQQWRSCRKDSVFGPWKVTENHKAIRDIAEKAKLI